MAQFGNKMLPFGGVNTYLLDTYGGAAVAYSLRKLSASTTNVVRVRRSSDNAEQDFTAAQVTDGTLTAFCGAGDGFVSIWYDQSGLGNNLTQTSAANQPQIVSLGSLILKNSKPAIFYADIQALETNTPTFSEPSNFFCVNSIDEPVSARTNRFVSTKIGLPAYLGKIASSDTIIAFNGTVLDTLTIPSTNQIIYSFLCNTTTSNVYMDNVLKASGISGSRDFTGFSIVINGGTSQELIAYQTNQDANRSGITTEINNYYNTY